MIKKITSCFLILAITITCLALAACSLPSLPFFDNSGQVSREVLDNYKSASTAKMKVGIQSLTTWASWMKGFKSNEGDDPLVLMTDITLYNEDAMRKSGKVTFYMAFFDDNENFLGIAPISKVGTPVSRVDEDFVISNFSNIDSKLFSVGGAHPKKCELFIASVQYLSGGDYVLIRPSDLEKLDSLDDKAIYDILLRCYAPSTGKLKIEVTEYGRK